MTRLLILGASPLPFEPGLRQYAANLRTWHFTRPLLDDGHRVRLVGCRTDGAYAEDLEPTVRQTREALEYDSVAPALFQDDRFLTGVVEEFRPDAIVGVNTHPSSRAVAIPTELPIWCDLNGWAMAEAQSKCHVYDDDRYLSHFWKMERAVVDRADAISTVSRAQAHATVGELAARGRLGKATFGYEFVHPIPNAVSEVEYRHTREVVRGRYAGEGDFVALWAGGYNTWTDVDLLYQALAAAMEEEPRLRFVSTGGALPGHDDLTFERFVERAREGPFGERFGFAGWVATEDVPNFYFGSDLGLNVDGVNYETLFGARNRLNDMMKAGLAVLTTAGTEIAETIAERRAGLVVPRRDPAVFAERLVWAARHPEELAAIARRGREMVVKEFSYERTTEPLRAWAADPRRAPDRGVRVEYEDIDFFGPAADEEKAALEREIAALRGHATGLERRYHELRAELGEIHQSRMWRLWMTYLKLRSWPRKNSS